MNKYLVALTAGGLMEMPELTYSDFEIIEASTRKDAVEQYNTKHNCNFFYGSCMAEIVNGKLNIINDSVSHGQVESLKVSGNLYMKPQMLLRMRISIDSAHKQRFTEEEVMLEFANDNVYVERKLVIRKTDGAVIGEILL